MATRTFVGVFAGATVGDPVRLPTRVDEVPARLAGLDVHAGLLGGPDRRAGELLQPYALETVCVRQDARVAAARTLGGEHGRGVVSLLRCGEHVLGSPDPLRTVRELLDGVERR